MKFIHLHIPKTAGGTFNNILRSIYGDESWHSARKTAHMYENHDVVYGHQVERNRNRPTITWLRDPVERLISHYYYYLQKGFKYDRFTTSFNYKHKKIYRLAELQADFMKIYTRGHNIELFLITERFEESLEMWAEWAGVEIPEYKNAHVNPDKPEVSATVKRDLREILAPDVELYERVKTSI